MLYFGDSKGGEREAGESYYSSFDHENNQNATSTGIKHTEYGVIICVEMNKGDKRKLLM